MPAMIMDILNLRTGITFKKHYNGFKQEGNKGF